MPEHEQKHENHHEEQKRGVTMPLWILGPLLGWAIATGTTSAWVAISDHFDVQAIVKEIDTINEEGSRLLRDHLREEERSNQQMIYLQGDMTEVKTDVKAMRDDMMQIKLMLQQAVDERAVDRHGGG
jgi:hypothetical protein